MVYQARIISSHDVSLDTLKFVIEHWIASKQALPGWNSVLKVSSTWKYGLMEDTLYVECSIYPTSARARAGQPDHLQYYIDYHSSTCCINAGSGDTICDTQMSQEKKTKYREVGTHLLCYKGRIHFDVYKVEFYPFLFSVRLQDLISRREAQEESHPKAADSGAYSCKHTLALQQPDWMLFIFQYLQKLINH